MQATRVFSVKDQNTVNRPGKNMRMGPHGDTSVKNSRPGQVLYIYDRVTTKRSKEREMKKRFGNAYQRNYYLRDPQPKSRSSRNPAGASRPYGSSGSMHRPQAAAFTTTREFYTGGAAVKKRSKLFIDNIINLFESIEERWIKDLDVAKKQAMLRKKLVEHRRGLCLALVILAILATFVFGVYKLFFVVRQMDVEGSAVYTAAEIAEASGIAPGDNLYSFRAGKAEEAITFRCPYLKTADISRGIPTKVSIAVEDDTAKYYAEFFGETLAMSAGLKVLGEVDPAEALAQGMTQLKLPTVEKAVAGRVIVFTDPKNERYVREMLGSVAQSQLAERISMIDMRDAYNIVMNCDNTYRFQFGSTADTELKLRMAAKTLNDTLFEKGTPARIDLSVTGEASVRYDLRLDLNAED